MNVHDQSAAFPLDERDTDTTPANPPPSAVADPEHKAQEDFNPFNDGGLHSVAGEPEFEGGYKCIPHACPSQPPPHVGDDGASSLSNLTQLPSVASIFDYEIVQGLLKPGVVKTEMEAFVPVGGMVAPERKRQEFHDYLYKKGFLSGIAKVLISLSDEPELPPKDTVNEYIAKCLGFHLTAKTELAESTAYAQVLRQRIHRLEVENDWMRRHLDNYEPTETPLDVSEQATLPRKEYLKVDQHRAHNYLYKHNQFY